MSLRKMILKDTSGGTELVFPVTPSEFSASFGRNVLKVSIHQMGDVNFWGQAEAAEISLSVLLPAEERSYVFSGGYAGDPYGAIEKLKNWQTAGTVLRYIVSDTAVNLAVLLSRVKYGEKDGTGDVYADLTLSEYRPLGAVKTEKEERRQLLHVLRNPGELKKPFNPIWWSKETPSGSLPGSITETRSFAGGWQATTRSRTPT